MEPCPATKSGLGLPVWKLYNYEACAFTSVLSWFIVNVSEFYSVYSSMYTVHATQLSVHEYALYMHICFFLQAVMELRICKCFMDSLIMPYVAKCITQASIPSDF